MRANQNKIEKTDLNVEGNFQLPNEELGNAFRRNGNSRQQEIDYLSEIESELKALWSEYIQCHDKYGFNDKTKALREKYFRLLRRYRNNKNWRQMI